MSTKIHLLPENLINQIAAGEVIERPASVVKELVENSLDANSNKIIIELEGGGKKMIRVSDDGEGMSREDALLSIERHATSKISSSKDLLRISSLGFRGEALASIASVSKVLLKTKDELSMLGSVVRCEGGLIKEVREEALGRGTVVEVRNLFYNVPVRRKFLRSEETELSHISEFVSRLCLPFPSVHFELSHQNRQILLAPKVLKLEHRLAQVFGKNMLDKLFYFEGDFSSYVSEGLFRLYGFFLSADYTRSTSSGIYFYVNRRFVRDKILLRAVLDAYHNLVPRGRYPFVILFIELSPFLVDVNVHPTKLELRFREQEVIYKAVFETLQKELSKPLKRLEVIEPGAEGDYKERVREAIKDYMDKELRYTKSEPSFFRETTKIEPAMDSQRELKPPELPQILKKIQKFSDMRIIGQAKATYIVLEDEDGLVVLDQHAVHERVMFEKLIKQYRYGGLAGQLVLFPQIFEFSSFQAQRIFQHLELFSKLGLKLENFGRNSFILKEVPGILAGADFKALIEDLLEGLSEVGRAKSIEEKVEQVLAVFACHSVVRAGSVLSVEEIKALLKEMDEVDFSNHCPHGRPGVIRISFRELEKRFHRR